MPHYSTISPDEREQIIEMIRCGRTRDEIEAATGRKKTSIYRIARAAGLRVATHAPPDRPPVPDATPDTPRPTTHGSIIYLRTEEGTLLIHGGDPDTMERAISQIHETVADTIEALSHTTRDMHDALEHGQRTLSSYLRRQRE